MTALHVRPIHFTAHLPRWRLLLDHLEAAAVVEEENWSVYALPGGGRLALHITSPADSGRAEVGFETEDLERCLAERREPVARAGGRLERTQADHGPALRLTLPDGGQVLVDSQTAGAAPQTSKAPPSAVAVAPLYLTTSVAAVADAFARLGMSRRVSSAGWAELSAHGLLGVHHTDSLSSGASPAQRGLGGFWAGDLEPVHQTLRAAGWRCDLVDEAYGRTLLVEHPDFPEHGEADLPGTRLWINENQTDTYGYTDHRPGA